jgi:hypothetical protein
VTPDRDSQHARPSSPSSEVEPEVVRLDVLRLREILSASNPAFTHELARIFLGDVARRLQALRGAVRTAIRPLARASPTPFAALPSTSAPRAWPSSRAKSSASP